IGSVTVKNWPTLTSAAGSFWALAGARKARWPRTTSAARPARGRLAEGGRIMEVGLPPRAAVALTDPGRAGRTGRGVTAGDRPASRRGGAGGEAAPSIAGSPSTRSIISPAQGGVKRRPWPARRAVGASRKEFVELDFGSLCAAYSRVRMPRRL